MMGICTAAGYAGVALAIVTTFAVQVGKLQGGGWAYPTFTLIICSLISLSLIPQWNAPVAYSEVLYAMSAIAGYVTYFKRKNQNGSRD